MGPLRLKDSVSSNQDIVAGIVCAGEVKSMKEQVKSSRVKSSQVKYRINHYFFRVNGYCRSVKVRLVNLLKPLRQL